MAEELVETIEGKTRLIVAIAAFFTGPSVTAVRTRGAFKSGFAWLRSSGEHAGLSTGPVGRWTYAHRKALRVAAVATVSTPITAQAADASAGLALAASDLAYEDGAF